MRKQIPWSTNQRFLWRSVRKIMPPIFFFFSDKYHWKKMLNLHGKYIYHYWTRIWFLTLSLPSMTSVKGMCLDTVKILVFVAQPVLQLLHCHPRNVTIIACPLSSVLYGGWGRTVYPNNEIASVVCKQVCDCCHAEAAPQSCLFWVLCMWYVSSFRVLR